MDILLGRKFANLGIIDGPAALGYIFMYQPMEKYYPLVPLIYTQGLYTWFIYWKGVVGCARYG